MKQEPKETKLSEDTAMTIKQMILARCAQPSLCDLCDEWGVTTEEFQAFLDYALRYQAERC